VMVTIHALILGRATITSIVSTHIEWKRIRVVLQQ